MRTDERAATGKQKGEYLKVLIGPAKKYNV
jgi:hypothetical protein